MLRIVAGSGVSVKDLSVVGLLAESFIVGNFRIYALNPKP